MKSKTVKLYSYFLPGFHEDPFNNEWWGKGFTEWDNVRKTTPQFEGHIQPHLPRSGEYDLNDPEVLQNQFSLAKSHGIDGFVIYDYWYEGKRPLGKVLDTLLKHTEIQGEFSLCWANHSWTRSWKNRNGALDVLIAQTYETAHALEKRFAFLCEVFSDPRYITQNGRPMLTIYLPDQVENLQEFCVKLKAFAVRQGLKEPYIVGNVNKWHPSWGHLEFLDAIVLGNPTLALFGPDNVFSKIPKSESPGNLLNTLARAAPTSIKKWIYMVHDLLPQSPEILDFSKLTSRIELQARSSVKDSPLPVNFTTFAGFDNSPRYKQRAKIVKNVDAQLFGEHLDNMFNIAQQLDPAKGGDFIVVNAWNEWGEGMALEPSEHFGDQLLKQVQTVINGRAS